jgi:cell division protein FtsZ
MTLAEVTEAAETIQGSVDPDANIFFGAVIHPRQQDEIRVTVIATGLRDSARPTVQPSVRRSAPPPSAEQPPVAASTEPITVPRERRDTDLERQWRPGATEWEREHPQPKAPRPFADVGDDDWDVPAFMRRPRR